MRWLRTLFLTALLALPWQSHAQTQTTRGTLPACTLAQMLSGKCVPIAPGNRARITDAVSPQDCDVGGAEPDEAVESVCVWQFNPDLVLEVEPDVSNTIVDNMGSMIADRDLQMQGFKITGVGEIVPSNSVCAAGFYRKNGDGSFSCADPPTGCALGWDSTTKIFTCANVAATTTTTTTTTTSTASTTTTSTTTTTTLSGQDTPLKAFPEAEGFGQDTTHARNASAQILKVTSLNDTGGVCPHATNCTLRAAMLTTGHRFITFGVAGYITVNSKIEVPKTNGNMYIAGQTAPGDGITVRASATSADTPIQVRSNNNVLRYFRIRTGEGGSSTARTDALSLTASSTDIPGVTNVIADHMSLSWSRDENIGSWYGSNNVTVQWSISSEAIGTSDGSAGKGAIFGKNDGHSFSFHHNLMVHNDERNPRVLNNGIIDIVNNVIFNPGCCPTGSGWGGLHATNDNGNPNVNIVKNWAKGGSDTGTMSYYASGGGPVGTTKLYVLNNRTPIRTNDTLPQLDGVLRASEHALTVGTRFTAPAITETTADQARLDLTAAGGAGASRRLDCDGNWVNRRDAVDTRIVDDVLNETGSIIAAVGGIASVGGYPTLAAGTACADTDGDSMPNSWETTHGLNPNSAADALTDADGDGYLNIEEYLNGTDPSP